MGDWAIPVATAWARNGQSFELTVTYCLPTRTEEFTENSRKEFEKFTDISWAPLPLFQVAMLMQTKNLLTSTFKMCSLLRNKEVSGLT